MRALVASLLVVGAAVVAAQAPGRGSITLQVTDGTGAPIGDVEVQATGPVLREGTTNPDGGLRLTNLPAGVYRLRLTRQEFITLEREVAVRAGRASRVETMLNGAPVPPPEPEPVPEPADPEPIEIPIGLPRTTSIPDFVENNFVGRDPRKDSPIGCLGTGRATLLQLREPLAVHQHDDADEWIYIVAGEGTLRWSGQDTTLTPGTFSTIPRTAPHELTPRGRNPLIVISILTGEPCDPSATP